MPHGGEGDGKGTCRRAPEAQQLQRLPAAHLHLHPASNDCGRVHQHTVAVAGGNLTERFQPARRHVLARLQHTEVAAGRGVDRRGDQFRDRPRSERQHLGRGDRLRGELVEQGPGVVGRIGNQHGDGEADVDGGHVVRLWRRRARHHRGHRAAQAHELVGVREFVCSVAHRPQHLAEGRIGAQRRMVERRRLLREQRRHVVDRDHLQPRDRQRLGQPTVVEQAHVGGVEQTDVGDVPPADHQLQGEIDVADIGDAEPHQAVQLTGRGGDRVEQGLVRREVLDDVDGGDGGHRAPGGERHEAAHHVDCRQIDVFGREPTRAQAVDREGIDIQAHVLEARITQRVGQSCIPTAEVEHQPTARLGHE